MSRRPTTVVWLGSGRYSQPLDAFSAKKWRLMAELDGLEHRVIGFSTSLRPRHFHELAHFYLLPQPPGSLLRYLSMFLLAPLALAWLALRHRGAIVVAQSPYEGAIGAAVKRMVGAFGLRQRLIIENHNDFERDLFLQRRLRLAGGYRWLMRRAARYAYRHADALRAVSSSTAAQARQYAPDLPQAQFMAFSDTELFRHTARSLPVAESLDIVYAGVLIPRKGVHHLLAAFAGLEEAGARLRLVGKAENLDYASSLRRQAAELGISARVSFEGAVTQAELARILGGARVMVLPSLSEGLGRVVVEAMLLGTPVIGSRVGGIPDMIAHGDNGLLVEPGDEAELARALRAIYQLDVAAMSRKARDFAVEYASPQQHLDGYRQLFALLADEAATPRPGRR